MKYIISILVAVVVFSSCSKSSSTGTNCHIKKYTDSIWHSYWYEVRIYSIYYDRAFRVSNIWVTGYYPSTITFSYFDKLIVKNIFDSTSSHQYVDSIWLNDNKMVREWREYDLTDNALIWHFNYEYNGLQFSRGYSDTTEYIYEWQNGDMVKSTMTKGVSYINPLLYSFSDKPSQLGDKTTLTNVLSLGNVASIINNTHLLSVGIVDNLVNAKCSYTFDAEGKMTTAFYIDSGGYSSKHIYEYNCP